MTRIFPPGIDSPHRRWLSLQRSCPPARFSPDGMTVIIITHNSALMPMGDRVIQIRSGKVSRMYQNEHPEPIERIEW